MTDERRTAKTDWDSDDAACYHRPRQPIEVRRRGSWKQVLTSTARVLLVMTGVAGLGAAGFFSYRFAATSSIFRIGNLDAVEIITVTSANAFRFGSATDRAAAHVPAAAVRERFALDVGQSVFAVPLGARRASVEEIAWVEAATVQRVLPNRLRVYLRERTPVAFLRLGSSLCLVDRAGVILPPSEDSAYSFPVITGLSESLPAAERQARVRLYVEFIEDMDRNGTSHSARLSEVDLSDPDDVRASVPEADGAVWLHFGRGRYQEKFEMFLQNRPLWQQSGQAVRSVDLRYRGQIVLNPDAPAPAPEAHPPRAEKATP